MRRLLLAALSLGALALAGTATASHAAAAPAPAAAATAPVYWSPSMVTVPLASHGTRGHVVTIEKVQCDGGMHTPADLMATPAG